MESPIEYPLQQSSSDLNARIRDIEDKLSLFKNRVLLLGRSHIEGREKSFKEIQELKKTLLQLKEENLRMKEILQRITEQLSNTARKEELTILQRQFDLFRKN